MESFLGGGLLWHFADSVPAETLFDARGLRLNDWIDAGTAKCVKERPLRSVWRVALPALDFYVKHDRPARMSWLQKLLRTGSVRAEFERGREIARRGVATPEPLAFGERSGRGNDGFLITRTVPGSVPLDLFLETTLPSLSAERQTRIRQRLATVLGRFLAQLHDAGVTHRDLHPGNLLLQLDGDDQPIFWLIDLHAVSVGQVLSRRSGLANLVILNRWFILRSGRTDRFRCWRAYVAARRHGAFERIDLARLGRHTEAATVASNLGFWRIRDRRCRASNRYFRRARLGSVAGHFVADLSEKVRHQLLAQPDALFARPGAKLLKQSPSSTVASLELPEQGESVAVVYKRFAVTSPTDPWVSMARPTAALRSWVMGHALLSRLLPTPRPLAVLHRYRYGLPLEGYLLTERVPDAVDLSTYVDRLADLPGAERRARTRAMIDRVARLLRTLHQRHLSHRDLKAPNLLLRMAEDGITALDLFFIDLVGVRRHGKLVRSRRVKNLARLHVSFRKHAGITRTDKLRFLRAYLAWGLHGRLGWKRWWQQVETATQAKVKRNQQNGRPLK